MSNSIALVEGKEPRNCPPMRVSDKKGRVIVISGPSGVGKGTICAEILKRMEDTCLSISATTRAQAASEVDGKDYYFLTREAFKRRQDRGLFLEWAEVFGHLYGTPRDKLDEMLAMGKRVLLEIDVQGGIQAKAAYPDAIMIFIMPPDERSLEARIKGRGRDSDESMQARLREARAEIASARKHYEHRVVNDDLEQAVETVIKIIKSVSASC